MAHRLFFATPFTYSVPSGRHSPALLNATILSRALTRCTSNPTYRSSPLARAARPRLPTSVVEGNLRGRNMVRPSSPPPPIREVALSYRFSELCGRIWGGTTEVGLISACSTTEGRQLRVPFRQPSTRFMVHQKISPKTLDTRGGMLFLKGVFNSVKNPV
jgi:hypothetical protein